MDYVDQKLTELARQLGTIRPCPKCGAGMLGPPTSEEALLERVKLGVENDQYSPLSVQDAQLRLGWILAALETFCLECEYDDEDDETDDALSLTTVDRPTSESLDDDARHVRWLEKGDIPEAMELLAEIAKSYPEDGRINLFGRGFEQIVRQYRDAFAREVKARRTAPIWQSMERRQELENLEATRQRLQSAEHRLAKATDLEEVWRKKQDGVRIIIEQKSEIERLERAVMQNDWIFLICLAIFIVCAATGVASYFIPRYFDSTVLRFLHDGIWAGLVIAPLMATAIYADGRRLNRERVRADASLSEARRQSTLGRTKARGLRSGVLYITNVAVATTEVSLDRLHDGG